MKKRRLKKKYKRLLILIGLVIVVLLFLLLIVSIIGRVFVNKGKTYRNGACVFNYPKNETIKEYGKELCNDSHEHTYTYEVIKEDNYNMIVYDNGKKFLVDKNNKDIEMNIIGSYDILSNALRNQMKQANLDIAYTSDFILNSDVDSVRNKEIDTRTVDDNIGFYFKDYDYEVILPLAIANKIVDFDFGKNEEYVFDNYINPDRKILALTYDDGPFNRIEDQLYDLMHKYDARCTFYYVGNRLHSDSYEHIKEGIELGLEFGSHSYDHADLANLSVSEAKENVMKTVNEVYDETGYKMKTFRPPYGSRNWDLEKEIDLECVLWNIDSLDWNSRDADAIYDQVMDNVKDRGIVLMHSLYDSSLQASEMLVPALIDQGYQLVSISELLKYK